MTNRTISSSYRHPFISKVRLHNFKSVAESEATLAPLTLIVGENSAGKSTILQSLRLMQQGMEDNRSRGTYRLNGDEISLGTIDDLRTDQAADAGNVSLGMDLIIPHYETSPLTNDEGNTQLTIDHTDGSVPVPDSFRLVWDIGLQGIVKNESSTAYMQGLGLAVTDVADNELFFSLSLQRSQQKLSKKNFRHIADLNSIHFDRADLIAFEATLNTTYVQSRIPLRATVEGPLPNDLIVDSEHPEVRNWIADDGRHRLLLSLPIFSKEDLIGILMDSLKLKNPEALLPHLSELTREELANALKKMAGIEKELASIESTGPVSSHEQDRWKDIRSDILFYAAIYRYWMLEKNIRYLGPLRKGPQHFGERGPMARGNIGQQGEFTGRILHSMGDTSVSVLMPNERQISKVKLVEAVGSWATELGLVEGVGTEDRAAEGITIRVKSDGMGSSIPLTSVGVGVSQLLPVLVLCLLAEPGSVILLEQPELHLHPALQQRLTDFFIAMVRSGRQLIVETHSEYMISRLRRRIVEDADDELLGLAKVVFAERDRETGLSSYREVELSPYGAIEEWPAGFFDQAAEEERAIILGGVKKLRKRAAEKE